MIHRGGKTNKQKNALSLRTGNQQIIPQTAKMKKKPDEMLFRDVKVNVPKNQLQEGQGTLPGDEPGLQLFISNFVGIVDSPCYIHE